MYCMKENYSKYSELLRYDRVGLGFDLQEFSFRATVFGLLKVFALNFLLLLDSKIRVILHSIKNLALLNTHEIRA
jgi:hypothetical protein